MHKLRKNFVLPVVLFYLLSLTCHARVNLCNSPKAQSAFFWFELSEGIVKQKLTFAFHKKLSLPFFSFELTTKTSMKTWFRTRNSVSGISGVQALCLQHPRLPFKSNISFGTTVPLPFLACFFVFWGCAALWAFPCPGTVLNLPVCG